MLTYNAISRQYLYVIEVRERLIARRCIFVDIFLQESFHGMYLYFRQFAEVSLVGLV